VDKPTTAAAIVAAVTGLVSAGAFKFYEFMLKQKREKQVEEKAEQALYRDDLIKRVERLEQERDEHLEQIIELMTEVAGLKVEVDYVKRENEILKLKIDAMRCTCLWRFTPLRIYGLAWSLTLWTVQFTKPDVAALNAATPEKFNYLCHSGTVSIVKYDGLWLRVSLLRDWFWLNRTCCCCFINKSGHQLLNHSCKLGVIRRSICQ
jgi:uncharacterized protein (UPF0335 family)